MMNRFCILFVFCIWCIDNSHQKPERCLLPQEPGMCMARFPRLYYDAASDSCKEFVYGGCGGNDNNFETLADCDNICVRENTTIASGDRCSFLPAQGDCNANIPRLYYDADTNSCKEFTYGGCGGNDNNFQTTTECQAACVKSTAHLEDDCYMKPEVGPCKAMIPRLYYDVESNTCKEFIYGGCQGNGNNFATVQECDKACVSLTRPGANYCYLAPQAGPCKANIPKLYFDPRAKTCIEFKYGGCEGNDTNENKFDTVEKCESACKPKTQGNICELDYDVGNCKALILRYYYNSKTQTCGEFHYGGCGGNENNFESLDECEDRCENHAPVSIETSFVILIVLATHVFGKDILALLSL